MTDIRDQLRLICDDPPLELVEHFQHLRIEEYNSMMTLQESLENTKSLHFHPAVKTLGLVMLETNNSNYHALITRGPLEGAIFYLTHDGDSRTVYPNLTAYLEAERRALAEEDWVEFMHPPEPVLARDQAGLASLVDELLHDINSDDAIFLLTALIPSLDLHDLPLLERIANHPDFFVPEALGNAIRQQPRSELLATAQTLASHPRRQAAGAGRGALEAIVNL